MPKIFTAALTTLLLLGPADLMAEDKPFKIEKRDFKKTYQVIAISPPDADPYLKLTDSVRTLIESEVAARLERRGYTVLPSSVLAGIRAEMARQVGGTTDNESGEEDPAKAQAVREHAYRELWFRSEIDAVATVRIAIHSVPMESDRVEWDGVKQKVQYEGRGKKYSASINVSSIAVAIYDAAGKALYVNYGGLEPVMMRDSEQLTLLPAEQLLLDEKKIKKAAQIAVKPI